MSESELSHPEFVYDIFPVDEVKEEKNFQY
jgi:hypothetical protein